MVQTKPKKDLTEGALFPKIVLFTLPLIATAVLQQLFNTADTVMVGRWGGNTPEECEIALAAVGSCGSLINLIVQLFMGLAVGAGVCVARDIGAKQYDDVSRVVHTSVLASLLCGVAVAILGFFAARPLLILMGTDPTVLEEAVPYICAYFCGIPASMVYNYCASILRSYGDTTRPLIFLSIAGVANVVFNFIMVLIFRTGAMGVGIATAASNWLACVLILLYMMRMDGPCRIDPHRLRIDPSKLRLIVLIGLPAGIQGTLFSISNVLIQSSINSFGPSAVAGNAAGSNLDSYIYTTQNALYHAALTFVGQNSGAGKYDRVKRSILSCAVLVTVIGLAVGSVMYLFGEQLLLIFSPEGGEVITYGMKRLSIVGITYFLCGLMETGCGAMRGLGKSITPMLVSLLGSCAIRIVWIYTLFAAIPTLDMLYISYPISWALTAAAHFSFTYFTYRQKKRDYELQHAKTETIAACTSASE